MGNGVNSIAHSTDGTTFIGFFFFLLVYFQFLILFEGLGLTTFSVAGLGVSFNPLQNLWVSVGQGTNSIGNQSCFRFVSFF